MHEGDIIFEGRPQSRLGTSDRFGYKGSARFLAPFCIFSLLLLCPLAYADFI